MQQETTKRKSFLIEELEKGMEEMMKGVISLKAETKGLTAQKEFLMEELIAATEKNIETEGENEELREKLRKTESEKEMWEKEADSRLETIQELGKDKNGMREQLKETRGVILLQEKRIGELLSKIRNMKDDIERVIKLGKWYANKKKRTIPTLKKDIKSMIKILEDSLSPQTNETPSSIPCKTSDSNPLSQNPGDSPMASWPGPWPG